MIESKDTSLEYINAVINNRLKKGLRIDCLLDDYFVYKDKSFNIFLGLDNVGKTNWTMWYITCLVKIHKKKFIIWSGENGSGQLMRDMLQFWTGEYLRNITNLSQLHKHITKYVTFVDNSKVYDHRTLLKIFADTDADACVIDPYTGLNHDRKISSQFDRNYNFCNDVRQFCNISGKTLFMSIHPQTEAARRVYDNGNPLSGHIQPPRKADCEGGQVFPNRCDNLICIHRYVSHKELYDLTMIHVYKVKDKETGGRPTNIGEPLGFDFNNGLGFTIGGKNPLKIKNNNSKLKL
jgi:hypothetical protein